MDERMKVSLAALFGLPLGAYLLWRSLKSGRVWSGGALYRRDESPVVFYGHILLYAAPLVAIFCLVVYLWLGDPPQTQPKTNRKVSWSE